MQQCQDVVHSILLEYIILPCFLCRVGLELGTIELRSLLGDITPTQITAAGGNALDFAGVAGNGGDAVTQEMAEESQTTATAVMRVPTAQAERAAR